MKKAAGDSPSTFEGAGCPTAPGFELGQFDEQSVVSAEEKPLASVGP